MNGNLKKSWAVITLILVTALPGSSRAGTAELQTLWDTTHIVVDGKTADWQLGSSALFSEENAAFTTANDSDYIYMLFRTNDIESARTISAAGLTIYLDKKGGKSADRFYVRFVGGPKVEGLMPMSGRRPTGEPFQGSGSGQHQRAEQREPTLYCYIEDKIEETSIPLDGSRGPAAATDTSMGFYTYEFRIPISADSGYVLGVGSQLGYKLGVGLVWGDMSALMPQGGGGGQGSGGMGGGPGGMGGPGGGGDRGNMGGGGHGRPDMPKKKELWIKTTLQLPPGRTEQVE